MGIRLSAVAEEELWQEAAYLESERPGWGLRLIDEVTACSESLAEHAARPYPASVGTSGNRNPVRFPRFLLAIDNSSNLRAVCTALI